jgi:endonuclease-3 related protein
MKNHGKILKKIYTILYSHYGPQGWWPLKSLAATDGFDKHGYHKNNFRVPVTSRHRFEIVLGAVLTQNTNWVNAEKALNNLISENIITPQKITACSDNKLADIIKSSGYYQQKTKKIKNISRTFIDNGWLTDNKYPCRDDLLAIWGIGPETADSILLYAFKQPVFVIDAYTRRLFNRLGLIQANIKYEDLQQYFHSNLKQDVKLYNEYHALIVIHTKSHCRKKADCTNCPLIRMC